MNPHYTLSFDSNPITNTTTFHTAVPSSPFSTRTVETIDGHCGQVTVNGKIVWQGRPHKAGHKAQAHARRHLQKRLAALFGDAK